jgi:hypothetical protein
MWCYGKGRRKDGKWIINTGGGGVREQKCLIQINSTSKSSAQGIPKTKVTGLEPARSACRRLSVLGVGVGRGHVMGPSLNMRRSTKYMKQKLFQN